MDCNKQTHLNEINEFIKNSRGLTAKHTNAKLAIKQDLDCKILPIETARISKVLSRVDSLGANFLQINFLDDSKILLTQTLVGFKPLPLEDLDIAVLPKVVSTSDLISVLEAIEDITNSPTLNGEDFEILKQMFNAVVMGGEAIGFELSGERAWFLRMLRLSA